MREIHGLPPISFPHFTIQRAGLLNLLLSFALPFLFATAPPARAADPCAGLVKKEEWLNQQLNALYDQASRGKAPRDFAAKAKRLAQERLDCLKQLDACRKANGGSPPASGAPPSVKPPSPRPLPQPPGPPPQYDEPFQQDIGGTYRGTVFGRGICPTGKAVQTQTEFKFVVDTYRSRVTGTAMGRSQDSTFKRISENTIVWSFSNQGVVGQAKAVFSRGGIMTYSDSWTFAPNSSGSSHGALPKQR